MIATGLAFELPIAMLLLINLGLVSPEFLRKQRRIAYRPNYRAEQATDGWNKVIAFFSKHLGGREAGR